MLQAAAPAATGFLLLVRGGGRCDRVGLGRGAGGGENTPTALPSSRKAVPCRRDPLQPERCAELLAALAAPERRKIVRFLVDVLAIPAVNVSYHLHVLRASGLIRGKKGRLVWCSLRAGVMTEAVQAGVPGDALNLGVVRSCSRSAGRTPNVSSSPPCGIPDRGRRVARATDSGVPFPCGAGARAFRWAFSPLRDRSPERP